MNNHPIARFIAIIVIGHRYACEMPPAHRKSASISQRGGLAFPPGTHTQADSCAEQYTALPPRSAAICHRPGSPVSPGTSLAAAGGVCSRCLACLTMLQSPPFITAQSAASACSNPLLPPAQISWFRLLKSAGSACSNQLVPPAQISWFHLVKSAGSACSNQLVPLGQISWFRLLKSAGSACSNQLVPPAEISWFRLLKSSGSACSNQLVPLGQISWFRLVKSAGSAWSNQLVPPAQISWFRLLKSAGSAWSNQLVLCDQTRTSSAWSN